MERKTPESFSNALLRWFTCSLPMCIIVGAVNVHPDYPLILAANRDEFYDRPSTYADFWPDNTDILGGRDLKAGGTWLGINKRGKVAAITNYRDPQNISEEAKSRGSLSKDFLANDQLAAMKYLKQLQKEKADYNGYNLLLFENGKGYHYSNYGSDITALKPGIFGLSNALLDTPWPKVLRLKETFENLIDTTFTHWDLLKMLEDDQVAPDELLPSTGIPYEWEKAISSICIKTENYGTCCSTVLTLDRRGNLKFTERSFPVGARSNELKTYDVNTNTVNA